MAAHQPNQVQVERNHKINERMRNDKKINKIKANGALPSKPGWCS